MGFETGWLAHGAVGREGKYLSCVVHGDDFVLAGVAADLEWALRLMEESFLVKVIGRLGMDKIRRARAPSTRSGPVPGREMDSGLRQTRVIKRF